MGQAYDTIQWRPSEAVFSISIIEGMSFRDAHEEHCQTSPQPSSPPSAPRQNSEAIRSSCLAMNGYRRPMCRLGDSFAASGARCSELAMAASVIAHSAWPPNNSVLVSSRAVRTAATQKPLPQALKSQEHITARHASCSTFAYRETALAYHPQRESTQACASYHMAGIYCWLRFRIAEPSSATACALGERQRRLSRSDESVTTWLQ